MSEMKEQDKQVFIQVLAQIVSGTLERLKKEGQGDSIRTVVGNAMYGVKLHEKGGIEIFQLGAGLLQEDSVKPFVIVIEEAATQRGKRDGTGPYKDSARKASGLKGRRKAAGETCPAVKENVDKLDSAIDSLIQ